MVQIAGPEFWFWVFLYWHGLLVVWEEHHMLPYTLQYPDYADIGCIHHCVAAAEYLNRMPLANQ